jgi:hypothetical protein
VSKLTGSNMCGGGQSDARIKALGADYEELRTINYDPKEGYVPNAEVALAIAEAVLPPVYGKERMAMSPCAPRTCTPRSIST